MMSVSQTAKALVILWSIFCITPTPAEATAGQSTSGTTPANIADHILHGIGAPPQESKVPILVPQADITWHTQFPEASISHARSCWSAYTNWYASYPAYYTAAGISLSITSSLQPSTYVYPASSTSWPSGNVSTYKLCDGIPRASYCPSTSYFNSSVVTKGYAWSTAWPTPVPEKPCILDQADCAVMDFGTNLNDLSDVNPDNEWAMLRLLGACGNPLDLTVPCLVQGGPVELMYFPVSTTGGDTGGCAKGTTVTPAQEPVPVTTLGSTFYPDKVYVSFKTLYAAYRSLAGPGGAAVQIGQGYSDHIFEFRSDEISTNCYASMFSSSGPHNPGYGPGSQLNFADLNHPPPATAYACQNQCESVSYEFDSAGEFVATHTILPNPCETIWDNFNPLIAVPTRLRSLRPDWASCRFWNYRQANVVFDPPIALTRATAVAKPTLPAGYSMTTAAAVPASTGNGPASRTVSAAADNLPSTSAAYSSGAKEGDSKFVTFTPVTTQAAANTGPASASTEHILAAGTWTITAISVSGATDVLKIDGSTVSVNGPAVTVGGGIVSMGTDGLVAILTVAPTSSRSTASESETLSLVAGPTVSGNSASRPGKCLFPGIFALAASISLLLHP